MVRVIPSHLPAPPSATKSNPETAESTGIGYFSGPIESVGELVPRAPSSLQKDLSQISSIRKPVDSQ